MKLFLSNIKVIISNFRWFFILTIFISSFSQSIAQCPDTIVSVSVMPNQAIQGVNNIISASGTCMMNIIMFPQITLLSLENEEIFSINPENDANFCFSDDGPVMAAEGEACIDPSTIMGTENSFMFDFHFFPSMETDTGLYNLNFTVDYILVDTNIIYTIILDTIEVDPVIVDTTYIETIEITRDTLQQICQLEFNIVNPSSPADIPTMTQWGTFLFILFFSTLILLTVYNRQLALAGFGSSTQSIAINQFHIPFDVQQWKTWLPYIPAIFIVGFIVIYLGWGEITGLDVFGMMLAVPMLVYLGQLWGMSR